MRAEVIIACRAETQANLERTVAGALAAMPDSDGVAVVFDGAAQGDYRLPRERVRTLRPWDTPRGCGQARHAGIETSVADVVVLCDGHMTLPPGFADAICDHFRYRGNARHVTCAHMQSLQHDWTPYDQAVYAGARLVTHCREDGNQHWPIAGKWAKTDIGSGKIAAPMGACYGMRRAFYAAMGAPLQLLEAWGQDEELLALCAYLCGGATYLLPLVVGHVYAAPRLCTKAAPGEEANVWANRLAVLRAMPLPDDVAADLDAWLCRNGLKHAVIQRAARDRQGRIDALRAHLAGQRRTWADAVRELGIERMPVEEYSRPSLRVAADAYRHATTTRMDAPPVVLAQAVRALREPREPRQIILRQAEVCERCGRAGTFRLIRGASQYGPFAAAPAKCNHCGHKAQVRRLHG